MFTLTAVRFSTLTLPPDGQPMALQVPASRVVTFYEEVVSKCIEEQVLL